MTQEWKISGYCRDYCGDPNCDYVWVSPGSFYQGTGFSEHDARLIAAAPELLEACRRLMRRRLLGEQAPTSAEDYEFARAAITKATGIAT